MFISSWAVQYLRFENSTRLTASQPILRINLITADCSSQNVVEILTWKLSFDCVSQVSQSVSQWYGINCTHLDELTGWSRASLLLLVHHEHDSHHRERYSAAGWAYWSNKSCLTASLFVSCLLNPVASNPSLECQRSTLTWCTLLQYSSVSLGMHTTPSKKWKTINEESI